MTEFDPFAPMTELAADIRAEELTASAAVKGTLAEVDRRDGDINAYVTVTDELARETAAALDERAESTGPLHGVPVALKDLRDLKEGVRHTFGSKLVAETGYVAERTSAAVERLESAGAVIVGKTNTPEFGHAGITDNPLVGPTASPVIPEYNAGGSSGGSAAAVASGMAAMALGSDTGGSIRLPATACGVYGHKPSYGVVPLDARPDAFGTKRHHSVIGPLTRTVEDGALALEVLSGYHPRDPGSVPTDIDFRGAVGRDISELSVAYSPDLDVFPVEPAIREAIEGLLEGLRAAGANVEEITVDHGFTLPELTEAVEATFAAEFVELAETLEASVGVDLREHPETVSDSLLGLLSTGDEKTIEDVAASGLVRTAFFDAVQDVFEAYDLLVTPAAAISQFPLESEIIMAWEAALTWPFNWTGHPVGAVPAGRTDTGGLAAAQFVGRQYEDDVVLAAAAAAERERPWEHLYPRGD